MSRAVFQTLSCWPLTGFSRASSASTKGSCLLTARMQRYRHPRYGTRRNPTKLHGSLPDPDQLFRRYRSRLDANVTSSVWANFTSPVWATFRVVGMSLEVTRHRGIDTSEIGRTPSARSSQNSLSETVRKGVRATLRACICWVYGGQKVLEHLFSAVSKAALQVASRLFEQSLTHSSE